MQIGVHAIGTYLPEEVRKNDWWSPEVVAKWGQRNAVPLEKKNKRELDDTPGVKLAAQAMREMGADPFRGSRERRVASEGARSSEMEVAAAKAAFAKARVKPSDIDFLLVHSTVPDYLNVANACRVHQVLELPPRCFSVSVEGMCNAFLLQLSMAQGLIASRQARYGLLIQSSLMSRVNDPGEPHSAWMGDGAAAVIVGPAEEGAGVLGIAHCTDGSMFGSIVTGVPGKLWCEHGDIKVYLEQPDLARRQFLTAPDVANGLVERALASAGLTKAQVGFWACHQPTPWFGRVIRNHLGLEHARMADTYGWTSNLSGANIPFILDHAQSQKLVAAGDVVAMFSGAAGMAATGAVLRWGGA